MINLAGSKEANQRVRHELEIARIDVVEHPENVPHSEVPTNLTGKLVPFTFIRAWYYWVAKGPVPLDVARELYTDPAGRYDVRAGGHCGCVEPETQARWYARDGRKIIVDPGGEEWKRFLHFEAIGAIEPGTN